jgi:UDP-GlcNAc3NAcA epimerase
MKFCSIVGVRPNFVKEFLIHRECRKRGIQKKIVHTGQHFDYNMSQVFFKDFELPEPDYYLGICNKDDVSFTGEVISRLGKLFTEDRPDFVLAYGDVNSTLAAAVTAAKLNIPFAHVEGGIRGVQLYNPEEINRRVSDVLAKVIYCCTQTDVIQLQKEGYEKERIVFSGDLMKDALVYTLKEHNIQITKGDYMLLTLHRQENVLNRHRLEEIVNGLILSGKRIIFPAHPRTRKQLEAFGLMDRLAHSQVEIVNPLGYVDMVRTAAGAEKILTDSGGVRREAYILKKPCIVLIELSWFPEIAQAGWKVLTKPDTKRIAQLIEDFEPSGNHPEIFGDGRAHERIMDDLEERFAQSQP